MSLVARFGAGCFFFASPTAKSLAAWRETVKAELGKIPSLSSIEFDLQDDWIEMGPFPGLSPESAIKDSFGQPGSGTFTFEVSIPERVQRDISNGLYPVLGCTRFRVATFYEYEGPTTLVRCLDGDLIEDDPSDAVVVVREFLTRELSVRRGCELKFAVLGPSPFHANFSVVDDLGDLDARDTRSLAEMYFERKAQLGYAEYYFCQDYSRTDLSREEFSRRVAQVLARQLAFFYAMSVGRATRIRNADLAEEMRENLVRRFQKKGAAALLYRTFRSGAEVRNLLVTLIEFENVESRHRRQYQHGVREFESQGEEVIFEREMEDTATASQLDDLKSARETAVALDDVRKKEFEVAVVSLSTLLGAIAGAVASLISG